MYKLIVFVDKQNTKQVKQAIFKAGGGHIGNYDCCCFISEGLGQFRPLSGSNPQLGNLGRIEQVEEYRIETVVEESKIQEVVAAMKKAHPYETRPMM